MLARCAPRAAPVLLAVRPAARRSWRHGCGALAVRALATEARDPRGAVVKIFNTRQRPGWTVPWQDQPVESSSGSGAVIRVRLPGQTAERQAVLTAAHVVADSRYLQVQRSTDRFSGEKFRARVVAVCHEADLALLSVEDPQALSGVTPLEVACASRLPHVFDKVRVVGYPMGGDACSITEGVVSRVEVQEYSHSLRAGLALTVDAAINSGNSGGPLVDVATTNIVGVAFQKLVVRGVELQGHAVPAPLIQRFLEEVAALPTSSSDVGEDDRRSPLQLRLPSLGCDYQTLEPAALRSALGLGSRTGILLSRLHHDGSGDSAGPDLQAGDVLMEFNGHRLDELGFCELLGRRLHFAAARDLCLVGERVPVKVCRDGQELELEHVLHPARYLVPRGQFDTRPRFFICGGLVFQPLSHEYLQGWSASDRPPHLQYLFLGGHLVPERTEAVMVSQVLADEANAGYDSGWVGAPIVQAVNGEPIRDLADLVAKVRAVRAKPREETGGFLLFDVVMSTGTFKFALPVEGLDQADARIHRLYGTPPSCCSQHFIASDPGAAAA